MNIMDRLAARRGIADLPGNARGRLQAGGGIDQRMTAERVLLALLLGGIAVGCVLVLYPFFSSLLWAAILVFTTWPVCEWLRQQSGCAVAPPPA